MQLPMRRGGRFPLRPSLRPDRRAGKKGRRPAPSAAVGLPEATAEIIASLGEHQALLGPEGGGLGPSRSASAMSL